jgi:hypothetical protein
MISIATLVDGSGYVLVDGKTIIAGPFEVIRDAIACKDELLSKVKRECPLPTPAR